LFLGDATTDQDAAEFSSLHFALRENQENKEIFIDYKGIRFENFRDLEKLIKENLIL
jgi:2-hydroxy-3-keto-5-methylthiopentenyl-1-phosphate phosphatase